MTHKKTGRYGKNNGFKKQQPQTAVPVVLEPNTKINFVYLDCRILEKFVFQSPYFSIARSLYEETTPFRTSFDPPTRWVDLHLISDREFDHVQMVCNSLFRYTYHKLESHYTSTRAQFAELAFIFITRWTLGIFLRLSDADDLEKQNQPAKYQLVFLSSFDGYSI
jgi:hypothetical protein